MPHEEFAAEFEVFFDCFGAIFIDDAFSYELIIGGELFIEELSEGVLFDIPLAEHVGLPGGHVYFGAANADAILASVVLFLHEEEQFLEAPEGLSVFLPIVGEWL